MNDIEFFNQMVMPSVEEFRQHPGDLRRGMAACIMLQSMTEHYFWARLADPAKTRKKNEEILGNYKYELRDAERDKANWIFGEIADIANGMKHAKPKFFDLTLANPAVCGIMQCGFPLSREPHVFSDQNHSWLLVQLTDALADRWKAKLTPRTDFAFNRVE